MKKAIKYDFFYTPGSLESKLVCGVPSLHIETSSGGPFYVVLDLKKIDKNIGHVRNGSSVMYMDITPFKDKPVIKPVNLQIRERYGEEVFKTIDGIITKLRTALMNKDIKTLNDFYYKDCVKKIGSFESESYKKTALKKCKNDIYSRDSWYYKKSRMLYTLFYESYDAKNSYFEENSIALTIFDGTLGLTFKRYKGEWIFVEIDSTGFKDKGVL